MKKNKLEEIFGKAEKIDILKVPNDFRSIKNLLDALEVAIRIRSNVSIGATERNRVEKIAEAILNTLENQTLDKKEKK